VQISDITLLLDETSDSRRQADVVVAPEQPAGLIACSLGTFPSRVTRNGSRAAHASSATAAIAFDRRGPELRSIALATKRNLATTRC
jgi:hypothetical protein